MKRHTDTNLAGFSLAIIAAWLIAGTAGDSTAGDGEPSPAQARFHKGSKQVALLGGYGVGFREGSKRDEHKSRELKKVRPVEVVPRFGIGVTDPLLGDSFLKGNVEMLFEGAYIQNTEPRGGAAGGVGTTLRYNLLAFDRFVPFVDANLGIIGSNFNLDRQADGFNFNVGAGSGFHWFVTDRSALSSEVRWQHISNLNTKKPNNGINDVLFLVGVSYFFD